MVGRLCRGGEGGISRKGVATGHTDLLALGAEGNGGTAKRRLI